MPLNPALLGTQLLAAVDQAVAGSPVATPLQRKAIWDAIALAIITHIQVNGTVVVVSVSGVTVGPGVSGPGAGTIL